MPGSLRTNYRTPNPFDADAIKRRGYQDQGILVISLYDPRLAWPEREMLREVAERLYGHPKARATASR